MTDYVKAWQCIGCGKIEAPQNCIGVCEDRKVQFVYAFEHEEALAEARRAQHRAKILEVVVRQLACTTPRKGECERSFRALQDQARRALSVLATGTQDVAGSDAISTETGAIRAARQPSVRNNSVQRSSPNASVEQERST